MTKRRTMHIPGTRSRLYAMSDLVPLADPPACFPPETWTVYPDSLNPRAGKKVSKFDMWRELAFRISPGKLGPCVDCTPEYQARMIGERRCARPFVQFQIDADGMLEGFVKVFRPSEKQK